MVVPRVDRSKATRSHTQNGLVLDNQESLDLGSKIFISKKEPHKESQVWNLIPCGDGCYSIVSPLTELGIDNSGNGSKECPVIQWDPNKENPNQQWRITALPNGNYLFTSVASGYNRVSRMPVLWPSRFTSSNRMRRK